MGNKTPRYRRQLERLFNHQNGLCCYCDGRTWLASRETKAQARERLGIAEGTNTVKLLRDAMATREHIKRRVDGGWHGYANLKMACQACNSRRHHVPADEHRVQMQLLVVAGLHPVNRPNIVIENIRDHRRRGLKALALLRAGMPFEHHVKGTTDATENTADSTS